MCSFGNSIAIFFCGKFAELMDLTISTSQLNSLGRPWSRSHLWSHRPSSYPHPEAPETNFKKWLNESSPVFSWEAIEEHHHCFSKFCQWMKLNMLISLLDSPSFDWFHPKKNWGIWSNLDNHNLRSQSVSNPKSPGGHCTTSDSSWKAPYQAQ